MYGRMFFCMCMYYASVCIHVYECICTVIRVCAHYVMHIWTMYVHAHAHTQSDSLMYSALLIIIVYFLISNYDTPQIL